MPTIDDGNGNGTDRGLGRAETVPGYQGVECVETDTSSRRANYRVGPQKRVRRRR